MLKLVNLFIQYKNCPIAIYGLGVETEKVLYELGENFHIVGLLDSFREEGTLYGKQIMPVTECVKNKIRLIIVVARPGSCRAIARKIGQYCHDNNIDLLDVRGKDLTVQKQVVYNFNNVKGITKSQLKELVNTKDVISFDLFDTLIMRQVLFSSDVIELTECRLKEKNILIDNFCIKRQQAEKELAKDFAPGLEEIYETVLKHSLNEDISAKELAELEWSIDYQLIVPRQEMVEFAIDLYNNGKTVYIVTDTYYSKKQIEKLLLKAGITVYTDILVSCEYGTGKTQNLFNELRKKCSNKSCIHIGDDLFADVENAEKWGVSSCKVHSSLDLLENLGYLGMWKFTESLYTRLKIGMFIAKLLNSPFQFEKKDKELNSKRWIACT